MYKTIILTLILFSLKALSCSELAWLNEIETLNQKVLTKVQFEKIKNISKNAQNETIVAIIGDGINPQDFAGVVATNENEIPDNGIDDDENGLVDDYYGVNFSEESSSFLNDNKYHEKFVASLVTMFSASRCETNYPVKILPLKVTKYDGFFDDKYFMKIADAIDYAVERGAKVINMSLGVSRDYRSFFQFIENDYNKSFKYLTDAIERAKEANVILLGASSNDNYRNQSIEPEYPADLKHIISVTSVDLNHRIKRGFGKIIMTAFYGENIFGFIGQEDFLNSSGTSYATPMIAATIALALSINPTLSFDEVRTLVQKASIHKISGERQIRNGVFDPLEFLRLAL